MEWKCTKKHNDDDENDGDCYHLDPPQLLPRCGLHRDGHIEQIGFQIAIVLIVFTE